MITTFGILLGDVVSNGRKLIILWHNERFQNINIRLAALFKGSLNLTQINAEITTAIASPTKRLRFL